MKKNALLAIAGLGFFAFIVAKIGWAGLVPQMKAVWLGLPIVIGLSFLRLAMQSGAWATALRCEGISASTGELMGIRLASQGAGYLTVLGPAISEPMKIRLLRKHSGTATVATLVDTGTYWFASGLFGIFACLSAGLLVAHSRRASILLMVLAATFIAGLILMLRSKPLLSPLVRLLGGRCPSWLRKAKETEALMRTFASRHPRSIRRMFVLDFTCQVLLAGEVVAVFWILALPFHAGTILALEAANRGMKMITGWMPARIGADEGVTAGTFAALGLSSASGLALALTRRTRDLLACAVGFGWLAWKTRRTSSEPKNLELENLQQGEVALCRP